MSTPCGKDEIGVHCISCEVTNPDIDCGLKNMFDLYRTSGYCSTSENGQKCGDCRRFSYDMDDCSHNGMAAAAYRFLHGIREDNRKFEPR